MRDYLRATRERVVVFDGGMGATLEQFDLSLEDDYKLPGRAHEALVLNRPDVIEGVHTAFVEAGADVVETDSFQASRLKLEEWGLAEHTMEINVRAAEIARKAVGEHRFVAGSIMSSNFSGTILPPTKLTIAPYSSASFDIRNFTAPYPRFRVYSASNGIGSAHRNW